MAKLICNSCNGTGNKTSNALVTSKAGRPDLRTGYAQTPCNSCKGRGFTCTRCDNTGLLIGHNAADDRVCPDCKA